MANDSLRNGLKQSYINLTRMMAVVKNKQFDKICQEIHTEQMEFAQKMGVTLYSDYIVSEYNSGFEIKLGWGAEVDYELLLPYANNIDRNISYSHKVERVFQSVPIISSVYYYAIIPDDVMVLLRKMGNVIDDVQPAKVTTTIICGADK